MQSSLKNFLFSVCLSLIIPGAVFATEQDNQERENNQQAQEQEAEHAEENKEDSVVPDYDEYKVNDPFMLEGQVMLNQEAVSTDRPAPVRTSSKPVKEDLQEQDESNSAMSFNFIYYIIDKFKLADPMD